MNMNENPTADQLRELLRPGDDADGHHVLWVDKSGNVKLSRVPVKQDANGSFDEAHPDMQMRLETFQAGNEYVGPEAAQDEEWVNELLERLTKQWATAKSSSRVAYICNL